MPQNGTKQRLLSIDLGWLMGDPVRHIPYRNTSKFCVLTPVLVLLMTLASLPGGWQALQVGDQGGKIVGGQVPVSLFSLKDPGGQLIF